MGNRTSLLTADKKEKRRQSVQLQRSPTLIIGGSDSSVSAKSTRMTRSKTLVLGDSNTGEGLTDKAKTAINKSEALFSAVQRYEQSAARGELDEDDPNYGRPSPSPEERDKEGEGSPKPEEEAEKGEDHPLAELLIQKRVDISAVRERMEDMKDKEEELNLDLDLSPMRGLPSALFYAWGSDHRPLHSFSLISAPMFGEYSKGQKCGMA
jgi:hypothetical protein